MIYVKNFIMSFAVMVLMVFAVGCGPRIPTSDQMMSEKQEKAAQEAASQVGFPNVTKFTEKRLVSQLYELRDQENLMTYTYVRDMNGRLQHLCNSVGYGIPYATQFSSPEKIGYTATNVGALTLPQPEPNGLFTPPGAEGTWVQCIVPGGNGKISPVYVEDRVIVTPFKMKSVDSYTSTE
jgi:hypothetical protein